MEEPRDKLYAAFQSTRAEDGGDALDGSHLIGWCAVTEWMAPDGKRWLSLMDGGATGDGLPEWQRQDYLHNALHDVAGFYSEPEEGDDEPEP